MLDALDAPGEGAGVGADAGAAGDAGTGAAQVAAPVGIRDHVVPECVPAQHAAAAPAASSALYTPLLAPALAPDGAAVVRLRRWHLRGELSVRMMLAIFVKGHDAIVVAPTNGLAAAPATPYDAENAVASATESAYEKKDGQDDAPAVASAAEPAPAA